MVHQYKLNGYNIVLDTCSGSVHSVDDVAYDIIEMYGELGLNLVLEEADDSVSDEKTEKVSRIVDTIMDRYGDRDDVTPDEVRLCIDDVRSLVDAHKLYTPDTFEPLSGEFKKRSGDVIKALCLHVSHTCNLNCEYCFAAQGKYNGAKGRLPPLDFGISTCNTGSGM